MPLAVALEVADVLVNLVQPGIQTLATPQQRTDQQCQRQEQQRPLGQAVSQFAEAGSPRQCRDLTFQAIRHGAYPFQVQRFVAGDPEHLFVQRRPQALRGAEQLFLVQLQGDGLVEYRAQFAVQALQQVGAGGRQLQQALA
ncbi:hypothetical protein D3C73_847450 [compost metagenome]